MDKIELERFFEQLLTEESEDAGMPSRRNALASELLGLGFEIPTEFYERDAEQDFLTRVSAVNSRVPTQLIASAAAECAGADATAARRVWSTPKAKRRAAWAVGAIAASVLVVFVGVRVQEWLHPSTSRSIAAVQRNDAAPAALTAVNPPASRTAGLPPQAAGQPQPVYTAPNPPQAIVSHAVTAADYPAESVAQREQGTVKVEYLVQVDGNVGDCRVIESSGFARLDEAACTIVTSRWRFKPATMLDGSPVAIWMPASIAFQLNTATPNPPQAPGLQRPQLDDLVRRREIPSPRTPPATSIPPIAITSHAVTAEDYPGVSVRLQEQGVVGIEYVVLADGTVGDCVIAKSSGKPRLDDAACAMAKRRWKFKPATRDGHPVAAPMKAEVAFQLR